MQVLDIRPGFVRFKVSGKTAKKDFAKEGGGHRFQRIPPTEKSDRVHTSTITVVVLEEIAPSELYIDPKDLEFKATRGSGAGGQHRNVTDSAIQLFHKPSGIRIRCESGRSQHDNKDEAVSILRARLKAIESSRVTEVTREERRSQAGSGMRGDKIRTIRIQDDTVTDHRTNKRMSAKRYLKGIIEEIL